MQYGQGKSKKRVKSFTEVATLRKTDVAFKEKVKLFIQGMAVGIGLDAILHGHMEKNMVEKIAELFIGGH